MCKRVIVRLGHGYFQGGGRTSAGYMSDNRRAYRVLARFNRRKNRDEL